MHINAIPRVTMREYEIAITILNRRDNNYGDSRRLLLIKAIPQTFIRERDIICIMKSTNLCTHAFERTIDLINK